MYIKIEKNDALKILMNTLKQMSDISDMIDFDKYGKLGVEYLRQSTPRDTGLTAESWYYEIEKSDGNVSIIWKNSNLVKGAVSVAMLIQYGHLTKNGIWLEGTDYINPATKKVFNEMKNDIRKEMTSFGK